MNKQRFYEEDFNIFLKQLIDFGSLDHKQAGITKLVIDKGYDSLSPKQKYVFDSIIGSTGSGHCELCACEIPWCEMFEALDNGGYCGYCQHILEKLEDE